MERIQQIQPYDISAVQRAEEKWKTIAKPLYSLGLLEKCVSQTAGIFGNENFTIDKRVAVIMCADNGVTEEHISQSDYTVTSAVAEAIAKGNSNINHLAKTFRCDVLGVDIGMKDTVPDKKLLQCKIANGTQNIAKGRAMTVSQTEQAIKTGMDLVKSLKEQGYTLIVTGEMGIGNTTTSSAIASVVLNLPPKEVTGRGAGLSDERLKRKIRVIERAIAVNSPDRTNPLDILSKLGGYDIAGMTGLFLGGAVYRIPIVIDGVISAVSAVLAAMFNENGKDYMLCSHVSKEIAGQKLLQYLHKEPLITAQLCLGEGTGGIMLLPLLDGAMSVYRSSHNFESLNMERYVDYDRTHNWRK